MTTRLFKRALQRTIDISTSDYSRLMHSLQNPTQSESVDLEEYKNINQQLYSGYFSQQQENYKHKLNKDFDSNTILKADEVVPKTYYTWSAALFLLFDMQLYFGTSTYITMLATLGGTAALFYASIRNTQTLKSVTELKIIDNNQIEVTLAGAETKHTIPLSNFRFNVHKDQNSSMFGNALPGFVVKAGDNYYHVDSSARINRTLLEKVTM